MFLVHEHSILSLCFSGSKEQLLLASADSNGTVKVWRISTGKCLRQIDTASGPVTSLKLSASF